MRKNPTARATEADPCIVAAASQETQNRFACAKTKEFDLLLQEELLRGQLADVKARRKEARRRVSAAYAACVREVGKC